MSKKSKLIVILGPTASGKSSLAMKIAKQFNAEVISADSRTIFREMNIGTAKPVGNKVPAAVISAEDVEEKGINGARNLGMKELFKEKPYLVDGIAHWGINIVDPDEGFTVAEFKEYADKHISDIARRGKIAILAGGTGLYISAVIDNLQFTGVKADLELRTELENLKQEELEERLKLSDNEAFENIDLANRRRLIRAIEVTELTGKPLVQQQTKGKENYDLLIIGLDMERDKIYERIEARVDQMVADGLVNEVRTLKEKYGCEMNAMTGIGYRQVCAFLDGSMKLADAIDVLKRDTRRYAKRQMTWFKRDERIHWIKEGSEAMTLIEDFLK